MQGIDLSRRFYGDIVAPWLLRVAPDVPHSAALIGYGSELLGFDDETSKDHNWGPRVHIYLGEDDFKAHASRLLADFGEVVPETFLGEPAGWRSRPHPAASGPDAVGAMEHGLEFHTFEGRLEAHTGLRSLENLTTLDWLGLPEQSLLAFTAGAVFATMAAGSKPCAKPLPISPAMSGSTRSPANGSVLPRSRPLSAAPGRPETISVPASLPPACAGT